MFGCKTFISVKVKWKNALKLVLTAQSALVQQWPTGPSLGPVLWRHATTRAPQWGQNLIEIAIKYSYYFNITISRIFVCNISKTLRINIVWHFAAKFSQVSNFFMNQLSSVPTLRAFWDLEKTVLHEIRVSGTAGGHLLTWKSPTCTYISQKPW